MVFEALGHPRVRPCFATTPAAAVGGRRRTPRSARQPHAARMLAMRTVAVVTLSALALGLACCGGSKPAGESAVRHEPAPDVYRVKFETSKGDFTVEVTKAWAPEGAERFYRLIEQRFYDDARFFRAVRNFVVQFGINGDPAIEARWRSIPIPDDAVRQSNKRGTITFATSGPNSRTTQVFINLRDNSRLDHSGFAPFGQVIEGIDVVEGFFNAYGDGPPGGVGPEQDRIESQGNAYLEAKFPRLDYVKHAQIVPRS
jgi:peptidyl-prolyl cis-trans isomerase A (cyclophilin A)